MGIVSDDASKIIDDLSLVYWGEISNTDPSYVEAVHILKELCCKYRVTYRSSVSEILKDITNGLYEGYVSLLETLKEEIVACSSTEMVSSILGKIESTKEEWRKVISNYVANYDKLFDILDGGLEAIDSNLSDIFPREVRLVPKEKFLYDDNGWLVFDNDENVAVVLESKQEAEERVANEDKQYEEMRRECDRMKATLPSWMEYLLALPEISRLYQTLNNSLLSVDKIKDEFILGDYRRDLEFMNSLDDIMAHDRSECEYLYHGTDYKGAARGILENGLYMRSEFLELTTYSEFSKEDLLLYSRGFMGEVGTFVVIIKKPNGVNIVRETTESEKDICSCVSSGLAGLECNFDYIVPKEYIVGYVDKIDRQVVYQKDFSLNDHVSVSNRK